MIWKYQFCYEVGYTFIWIFKFINIISTNVTTNNQSFQNYFTHPQKDYLYENCLQVRTLHAIQPLVISCNNTNSPGHFCLTPHSWWTLPTVQVLLPWHSHHLQKSHGKYYFAQYTMKKRGWMSTKGIWLAYAPEMRKYIR